MGRAADLGLWLSISLVREAVANPFKTISAIWFIDRFGIAGARFVGRAGSAYLWSQLSLAYRIGLIGVEELLPAAAPRNLLRPLPVPSLAAGTTAIGVTGGAVAVGALMLGPQVTSEYYSNPSNYPKLKDGSIVPRPEFIYGSGTM